MVALLGLVWTYWQIRTGREAIDTAGESARFAGEVFGFLAPVVMAVATLFSSLLTAAAVAQEKDRKTILLLLLTRLNNSELVLGKLLASLLSVLTVIAACLPFFLLLVLMGGVSYGQVGRVFAVSVTSALAAGSLGSTIALWREKTFQALAITCLAIVVWLLVWEGVAAGALGSQIAGYDARLLAAAMSPWQGVLAAAQSDVAFQQATTSSLPWGLSPVTGFLVSSLAAVAILNGLAIALVRVWNPSRESRDQSGEADRQESIYLSTAGAVSASSSRTDIHKAPGRVRPVWDNPILWREVRTWAYGRKILLIRLGYLLVVALSAMAVWSLLHPAGESLAWTSGVRGGVPDVARPVIPLLVVSLLLVNALAVTSLTSERDTKALDLLLVTDLTPKEIIFGKLGGVFYNAKEMVVLPLLLVAYVWFQRGASTENLVFVFLGFFVLLAFAAVLGLHCGMTYLNSRQAVAVSVGTLLFLLVGISICMRMMLVLGDQFNQQLVTFLGFIAGGGLAMYVALGWRLQSTAMAWASTILPLCTFFVITSFLQQQYGSVFLVTMVAYGFATAAMLVPAVAEFDVATGRTSERRD